MRLAESVSLLREATTLAEVLARLDDGADRQRGRTTQAQLRAETRQAANVIYLDSWRTRRTRDRQ